MRYVSIIAVLALCCKPETPIQNPKITDPWEENYTVMTYSMNAIERDEQYNEIVKVGQLTNVQLKELSGLAPCTYRSDWLYAHNDGGDYNRMFIIDTTGKHVKSVIVPYSGNRDMEDMAVDPNPFDGATHVYLGDIGDNNGVYPELRIYRIKEEVFPDNGRDTTTEMAETFKFVYPDGPRDAEALLIDPWSHHMYIATKRDAKTTLYKAKFPFDSSKTTTLEKVAQLPFNGIVGGDISSDGKHIVLKTYLQIFMWTRNEGETVQKALSRPPKMLPYTQENQGEAFCWSSNFQRYYTISEGTNAPVFKGSRK